MKTYTVNFIDKKTGSKLFAVDVDSYLIWKISILAMCKALALGFTYASTKHDIYYVEK